jgi:F0F1-type ATP synthase epsilon subunit
LLADVAERAEEIDVARARMEREQAEKALGTANISEEELERMQLQLERASCRLQLSAETK